MQKKHILIICLGILSIVIASCGIGSLDYISFKDPKFHNRSIQRICIYAQIENMVVRNNIEQEIAAQMNEIGIDAVISLDILPPTREWSQESIHNRLIEEHFDSFLRLELSNHEKYSRYVPSTTTVSTTTDQTKNKKSKKQYTSTTTTVDKTDGYTRTSTLVNGIVNIIDTKTHLTLWQQTIAHADGYGYNMHAYKNPDFLICVAEAVIDGMAKDKLIKIPN